MWRYSRSSSDLKRAHPDTPVPYQCQRAVEDIRIQLRFCHGFDSRTEQAIRPELRTPFHCMGSLNKRQPCRSPACTGSKSHFFPVHFGLRQGCLLTLVLFIIFMDRISRRSQGPEGVRFGDHTISSLLFGDDFVLAPSYQDLQHALGWFAAGCEAAGMRISTSKSEAMVLSRKRVACPLQVGGEFLPQVEEFKYLGVLFTSEGRLERETDRRISAASAVMRSMYRSVVVKKELSRKAKLSIYRSIYVPTLTYGHDRKDKIPDTGGRYELSPQGGWALP
ncbi:hypothetical protein PO909_030586 [Leuciscus waleckii]